VPQPTLVNIAPVTPLPKTTSDAQEYYIREFAKRGFSRPVAEGIVAGMGSESGLDPTINERDPTVLGSRGGFGLYQLTGPRRIAFERWASENGKNVNDDQAQIDFMMTEFAGPERKAYDALIQSPDAQSAATVFTDQFLRPGVSHSVQSANEAARMSGQPYDPAMAGAGMNIGSSTMGGPDAGGALPQTVEGILSSLYPNAAEDEKAAHRKDIWRGLSQGLSALSQGGQVDLSNIAANADTRRRQYVLDTREKEKAKAAASLVYSQTGDADMAAGVASGAISYTDVLNERQMKRVEKDAQDARLKDAATTDALVTAMKAGNMSQESIDLVQKGGVDALSAYQKIQADQTLLEQEAKQQDIRDQNVADARFILSTAAPGSIQARAAERVIALNGEEDVFTLMKDRAPAADAQFTLGAGEVRYGPNGEVIATGPASAASDSSFTLGAGEVRYGPNGEVIATGPASSAATSGFTLGAGQARYDDQGNIIATGPAAPPNMQYALGPDGQVVLVPATAPTAAGGAPATGGAPAGTVGGAFGTMFGSVNDAAKAALLPGDIAQQTATLADTIAGTAATEQATATAAEAAPVDLEIKKTDLAAAQFDLQTKIGNAPTAEAKATLEVEAANLANEQAAVDLQIAKSSQFVDAQTKQAALAAAEQAVKNSQLDYDTAVATAEKAKTDAAALASKEYVYADRQFAVAENSAQEVFKNGLDFWTTGMGGKLYTGILGGVVQQTDRTSFLATVRTLGAQSMFDALITAKEAGVTLTPVSNLDLKALGESVSRLATPEDLKGEVIVKDAAFQMNYTKDALYGPKDLMRYDEFGQPYQVGQNTLGVTEDTFARHWMGIPPDVKEAWKAGEITDLPTNDPAYAEAAKIINTMTKNFELYQGPVDRSVVGSAEPPASGSFEPPPANLPVPNGITAEQWPSVWAELSPADQAKYIQQNSGGN
jgi:hypothetical protein